MTESEIDGVKMEEMVENKPTEGTKNQHQRGDLAYSIEDNPPWYLCLLLGFQVRLKIFFLDNDLKLER